MAGVNNTLPSAPRGRRFRHPAWWLLLLLALAATAWLGWREYDHRAAIREAQAAGFRWYSEDTTALIREDWRTAFRVETGKKPVRQIEVGTGRDLTSLRPLLLRLRVTKLFAGGCKDKNLDALQGLTGLQLIAVHNSPALQNVDALKGLTSLQALHLYGCASLQNVNGLQGLADLRVLDIHGSPALQNVDGLQGLTGLQYLHLYDCSALQNVDGLQGLTGLRELFLTGCPKLPATAVTELRAALPKTYIGYDTAP